MSYVRVIYDPPTEAEEAELDVNPALRKVIEKPVLNWMYCSASYKLFPKNRWFVKKNTVKDILVGERIDGTPITRKHRKREWVEDLSKRGQPHGLYMRILTREEFKHLTEHFPEYVQFLSIEGAETEKVATEAFELQQKMMADYQVMKQQTAKDIDEARKLRDRQVADFKRQAEEEIQRAAEESGMTVKEIQEFLEMTKKSQQSKGSSQGRK